MSNRSFEERRRSADREEGLAVAALAAARPVEGPEAAARPAKAAEAPRSRWRSHALLRPLAPGEADSEIGSQRRILLASAERCLETAARVERAIAEVGPDVDVVLDPAELRAQAASLRDFALALAAFEVTEPVPPLGSFIDRFLLGRS